MARKTSIPEQQPHDEGGELPASLQEQLAAAWEKRQPKWYERLAPAQKHWVDKLVAIRLDEFTQHLAALDREDSQLAQQIAELTTQVTHLSQRLAALEARLNQPESGQEGDGQD
jgi:septal ring factor EnvC (AmiA/AmiB activator)